MSFTVPSATRLASTAPVKALVFDPMRSRVSPSGFRPLLSAISPKPATAVSPLRTTPMTRPGTCMSRNSSAPVNSTVSASSLLSARALPAEPSHTLATAAMQPRKTATRLAGRWRWILIIPSLTKDAFVTAQPFQCGGIVF